MPRDSLMSSLRVFCLVVTWTTASVTNLTLSIRDSGTDPSGSSSVNSTLHSHVPHVPCCWFFTLKKNKSKRLQKQSTTHQADEENSSYVTRKLTGRHDTIKMHGSLELTCSHCFPSFYPFKAKKIKNDAHSVPDSWTFVWPIFLLAIIFPKLIMFYSLGQILISIIPLFCSKK